MKKILILLLISTIIGVMPCEAKPPQTMAYQNEQYGFELSYPSTWQQRATAPGAAFTIFNQNKTAGISVNVANFTGDKTTVMKQMETKAFRDNMLSGIRQRFSDVKLIEYRKISLGGLPANLFIVQYTINNSNLSSDIVSAQILSICQRKAYSINFESAKSMFTQNYQEFEKIISTIKFIQ